MVTCDQQKKVPSSQKVLLWIFLEVRYSIWRFAELNRLLVGTSLIQLNIKLQQDDRTVCCAHKIVIAVQCIVSKVQLSIQSAERAWAQAAPKDPKKALIES